MIDLPPYVQTGVPVKNFTPVYRGDKYGLTKMNVGDTMVHYGVTQNLVSPYLSYYKKAKGWIFKSTAGTQDNRKCVKIERMK